MSLSQNQTADKQRMTVAISGGTREVVAPRLLRQEKVLISVQEVEIARLALILEGEMGTPVVPKCAYSGGKLYLLQCRPISP